MNEVKRHKINSCMNCKFLKNNPGRTQYIMGKAYPVKTCSNLNVIGNTEISTVYNTSVFICELWEKQNKPSVNGSDYFTGDKVRKI